MSGDLHVVYCLDTTATYLKGITNPRVKKPYKIRFREVHSIYKNTKQNFVFFRKYFLSIKIIQGEIYTRRVMVDKFNKVIMEEKKEYQKKKKQADVIGLCKRK